MAEKKGAEAVKEDPFKEFDLTDKDWAETLKAYANLMDQSRRHLIRLTCASLYHFEKHGSVDRIESIYNTMPLNRERRSAYLEWLKAFSPIQWATARDGSKVFSKDKRKEATPFDLKAAFAKPFWDFLPDKPDVYWMPGDVVEALERVTQRFRGGKKMHAADGDAMDFLNFVDRKVVEIRNRLVEIEQSEANNNQAAA